MPKKKIDTREFINLIKVQDLRMIIALDEHGTILNAANVMGLSQPAITKRLQDLEKDLGITLFHRMSRGVEPTPYGEIVIKHAHIILNQLRRAESEVSDLSSGLGGRLTIGMPVSASMDLVSEAISELIERRKNVQISLVNDYNIRLIPSLKRGNLDLIVGRLPENQQDDINIETFYQENLKIIVGTDHPLTKQKKVTSKELLNYNWIMPPANTRMFNQVINHFRQHNLPRPVTSIYALSYASTLKILHKQNLIAVFPAEAIADEVKGKRVAVLDTGLCKEAVDVGIITRKAAFNSPAAQMFMDIIRKAAKKRL